MARRQQASPPTAERAVRAPSADRDDLLDEEALLAAARARTGLEDFGDPSFREPLRRLLWSIEHEARLTPAGRAGQHARIVGLLVARLQTRALLASHPEIENEKVAVRFVVVGFPRTGTTLLHRLLARDPRTSALAWWECRHPAPLPGWSAAEAKRVRDPRLAVAEAEVAAMLAGNPALAAVHPLDALAPDEDVMLLEHAFQSSPPAGSMNVPSYLRWHLEADGRPAYAEHARLLRSLQWQKRVRGEAVGPFVLKAPHHMLHLDRLFEQHPEATVIQTHRDPIDTLPSLASMALELRRLSSDAVEARACADYALTTARARIERLERVRRTVGEARFVDVWFGDVVQKPLEVVDRIYARIGLELPDATRAEMARFVAENGRDRRPAHGYTLSEFGLEAEAIAREFAAYREAHVLPYQRPD
ncbi:MAG: sulfotransferase [Myxococcota bacterium]